MPQSRSNVKEMGILMAGSITKINRDIADNETFSHTGSVELQGNVGKGAVIDIQKGGILVKGSVADDASITTKGGGGSISISGNNVTIRGSIVGGSISGVTIINGKVVSGGGSADADSGLSGITIEKTTGSGVTLQTDGAIELNGSAGDGLRVKADGSINLQDAGYGLKANSGGSFHGDNIGASAKISAGGSLHIEELGHQSIANSGGSSHFEKIGNDCAVSAGGSARAESVGRDSSLSAGGSAKVGVAHTTASISAGGSKKIGRTSANDSDFSLSASFRAATKDADESPNSPEAAPPAADENGKTGKPPKLGFNL